MHITSTRRKFLGRASGLAATSFLGVPRLGWANPPLETRRIRLVTDEAICLVPQFLSGELLRLEGFTEVEYVPMNYEQHPNPVSMMGAGKVDFTQDAAVSFVTAIDAEHPVAVLSGIHIGCWQLLGNARVRTIRDLKGKRIPILSKGAEEHLVMSSVLAYVGLDPRKDVEFVVIPQFDDQLKAFQAGGVDALFAIPPQPQRLRAEKIGHVIVDGTLDRPWNQYYCCMAGVHRDFAKRYPVATKRALRAILKATDICARNPQVAARFLVDKGHERRYDVALEVLKGIPFGPWREFNPEATLRFHALRLREVGMIKADPHRLIAQGTDWRYLNELKKELKS